MVYKAKLIQTQHPENCIVKLNDFLRTLKPGDLKETHTFTSGGELGVIVIYNG